MMKLPESPSEITITIQSRLENHIARLESRLVRLRQADQRLSWLRLGAFILGLAVAWLAAAFLPAVPARLVWIAAALLFITVLAVHRRLDRWRAKFTIWQEIRRSQLSRLRLDWEQLPIPAAGAAGERRGLDIDLDLTGPRSLHHLLDRAVSTQGSRRLANWLSDPLPDLSEIERRQAVVRELSRLGRFRDRLLLNLHLVSKGSLDGQTLLNWLAVELSGKHLKLLLRVGWLLTTMNLFLLVLNLAGVLPAYWPYTFGLYLVFALGFGGSVQPLLGAIVELDEGLDVFSSLVRYLESLSYKDSPHLARLCAPFQDPHNLPSRRLRQVKLVTAMVGLRGNLAVWLLLNLALPWDFLCAWLAGRIRAQTAALFPAWLEAWYDLEALASLGDFAALHPEHAFPMISPGLDGVFQAQRLGHPLIPTPSKVCNDFSIRSLGEVLIITGSNMAGKSTFIKTIGINLCLAYAGGAVDAAELHSLPLRLHTCMRITDSIADGFSYFYAEVKCLKRLLEELNGDHPLPVLYLIDEIFRGTNNRERLLGSQAYVKVLIGAHGCGLIATHDLELAHLAEQSRLVRNFHFRDQVVERRLFFDYQIHPGPSPTTNALKIMQMEGLPVPEETEPHGD
jgi:ABC-type multidrug transport system fused ATPase/permease subunit